MEQPRSPLNGTPLPEGKRFRKGDERAANAGRKSGQKRREQRTLKQELEMLLAQQKPDEKGELHTLQEGISAALVKKALHGDTRAYELIRDTLGQKPVDKVEMHTPDFSRLDAIGAELMKRET